MRGRCAAGLLASTIGWFCETLLLDLLCGRERKCLESGVKQFSFGNLLFPESVVFVRPFVSTCCAIVNGNVSVQVPIRKSPSSSAKRLVRAVRLTAPLTSALAVVRETS